MKVLIITWMKYNNYGTVLQAYALQKKIKKLGYEAKTLDDHGVGFDLIDKKKTKFLIILTLLYTIIRYPFNRKNRKKTKSIKQNVNVFDTFKENYIDIEYNLDDKRYLNNHYQVFIAGSDQIWSPLKTIFSKHYYLDFVDQQNSKISYAPSTGQSVCSDEFKKIIKPLLSDFEYISVREQQGKKILNSITDKEINVVLDPTLLLTNHDWDEITAQKIIKNDYVFAYFLGENSWYNDYLEIIKEKYNLKIFVLKNDSNIYLDGKIYKKEIEPSEFLSLIKYAKYVITDSFHGSIFSLIFEKEFACLKRFEDNNAINNQNSRLYNLFKIINLEERFIDKNNQVNLFDKQIDYKKVNKYLKNEIDSSELYLSNALENCKGNKIITHNCTSCMACFNSCPVDAIKIEKDKYGEFRPYIDSDKCIKCGKCKKVCPSNNPPKFNEIKKCYAAISKNKKEMLESASGGIAYEISKDIILNDGIVYGVIIDKKLTTKHVRVDNILDLKDTKGSKYAQSYIGNTFTRVKKDLKDNKRVLFVGSPCQVAGLKNFLNKDYDNLITVDLVCHGNVPNGYIKEYCQKINKNINKVTFREKRKYCLKLYNNKLFKKIKNDKYLYTFLKDISLKESCHHCIYATNKRMGDITLGDFWALKEDIPYSIVMVNSSKGEQVISNLNAIELKEKDINKSIKGNDSFEHPQGKHPARINFNKGVIKGFNIGLKTSKINKIIRREKYPRQLRTFLDKINDKISKIRNGEGF